MRPEDASARPRLASAPVQRLFLGSVGLGALPGFLDGRARGLRVAFVPTSAKPMPDQSGVRRDHGVLTELGLVIEDLDI
jgi:hypothetical protein